MNTTKQYKIVPVKNKINFEKIKITDSNSAFQIIKKFWNEDVEIYESVFILLLSSSNTTIGWAKISQGGITGSVIDIKLIAKFVVDSLASGIILCHNHPSGNLKPSNEDKKITNNIKDALKLFDCQILDHIIINPDFQFYSFADNGDI